MKMTNTILTIIPLLLTIQNIQCIRLNDQGHVIPALMTADIVSNKFTDTETIRYIDAVLSGTHFYNKLAIEMGRTCSGSIYLALDAIHLLSVNITDQLIINAEEGYTSSEATWNMFESIALNVSSFMSREASWIISNCSIVST